MRFILTLFLFLQGLLYAAQADFDVAVVGTSPVSMIEAIYHIHRNERVLIIESDPQCGGAWKSIDICGVAHADLGCHLIGSDPSLKDFFEKYFDCRFVCMDHSNNHAAKDYSNCPNGFYFSKGCYELISKLKRAIDLRDNAIFINQKLDSIYINSAQGYVDLSIGSKHYTTAKLIITPASNFRVLNPSAMQGTHSGQNYEHLYILVEDPMPSCFTYLGSIASGMSRAMNLTPFLDMPRDGLQLIVIQIYGNQQESDKEKFLDAFKSRGLLTPHAKIIAFDTYVYHQAYGNVSSVLQLGGNLVELLETSSFAGMAKYLDKWKGAIVPLK